MLIVKVIIWFLLLILHKMSYIFAKQFLNQFRTSPVTVPKLMLILKLIIWFLLLILDKMSYHIFAKKFWNQFRNQFLNQLQYKSCYCSETYVNFESNYLIVTPNLT